jgi:hypothetical protein
MLINTRGLVALVVLNIGYDLGILSGPILAMVLLALATKFMTGTTSLVGEYSRLKRRTTMIRKFLLMLVAIMALSAFALAATKPDFSGSWSLDRARSFGIPGNMTQTMTITQAEGKIELETKLIQPGNERVVKDTYNLDGKEYEFTPQTAPNQPPAKGKRTATWLPGDKGIAVTEVTTAEGPKGPVTTQIVRKWTVSGSGELVIDMYIDTQNGSFETKRIFTRQ